ncbi:hypothetical protein ACQR0Z_05255 [Bradyrhizobium sp. HKCCYLS3077]|uniref:hypothetical protein n=1 Tax=Bradyrhizobium sp. HKCCYLS3077 TaxID=3420761 RepID=UPI003EBAB19C
MNLLFVAVAPICFLGALVAVVVAIYSFFAMLQNERPDNSIWLTSLLGPLILFIPGLWTAEGNRARVRLIMSLLVFGACFLVLMLLGVGQK